MDSGPSSHSSNGKELDGRITACSLLTSKMSLS